MANCFLTSGHEEIETAILLEKATQTDLEIINPKYKNAVAFTDGEKVFINSDDNLAKVLPDYSHKMLKWLLWHEEYHKQLAHHNRFFKYLKELKDSDCKDKFQVSLDEVNIIMDILVHDSLSKMFPELIETAINNLAQMRNRNSLGYTFKTFNLEDMLDEYAKFKHKDKSGKGDADSEETEDKSKGKRKKDGSSSGGAKGHKEGGSKSKSSKSEKDETSKTPELPEEHDKTDWSKLKDISSEEFIDKDESEHIKNKILEFKKKKLQLAKLTETLNGMVTTQKIRTYARPSYVGVDKSIILKGRKYAKTSLYLVFDASGSMGSELALFKEIISGAIPQAMKVPCEWFSGYGERIPRNPKGKNSDYYKGTFKDILPVSAYNGYNDDGDRVIELCLKAEQEGYSPIGITDGGGGIDHPEKLKQLHKTVLVGHCKEWLQDAKRINPRIQILEV